MRVGVIMNNVIPQEGRWYSYRGNRELYQVINIDEPDRVIYFQDLRGDIDEVDFDEWFAMDLEPINGLEELERIYDEEAGEESYAQQRPQQGFREHRR